MRQNIQTFIVKIISRLYYTVTGIRIPSLREAHQDLVGAVLALSAMADMTNGKMHRDTWDHVFPDSAHDIDGQDLANLFRHYGSDKSTKHNYHVVYSSILKGKRHTPLFILEIGLGTNNPALASSMGVNGKPGASLRAFRDWAPQAMVYGADIDTDILFSEERIASYVVDQTRPASLTDLVSELPLGRFDLIIDDGLHTPWANFNTLNAVLGLLKPDGAFVVEDIVDKYLPQWHIAAALLSQTYDCQLIRMQAETVFIVKKRL